MSTQYLLSKSPDPPSKHYSPATRGAELHFPEALLRLVANSGAPAADGRHPGYEGSQVYHDSKRS